VAFLLPYTDFQLFTESLREGAKSCEFFLQNGERFRRAVQYVHVGTRLQSKRIAGTLVLHHEACLAETLMIGAW
jgi:hypothetical protein